MRDGPTNRSRAPDSTLAGRLRGRAMRDPALPHPPSGLRPWRARPAPVPRAGLAATARACCSARRADRCDAADHRRPPRRRDRRRGTQVGSRRHQLLRKGTCVTPTQTILVAEEHPATRTFLIDNLAADGYRALAAEDKPKAILVLHCGCPRGRTSLTAPPAGETLHDQKVGRGLELPDHRRPTTNRSRRPLGCPQTALQRADLQPKRCTTGRFGLPTAVTH